MGKRFSVSTMLLLTALIAVSIAWFRDRSRLAQENTRLSYELATATADNQAVWSCEMLTDDMQSTDFDDLSKKLYFALLKQKSAHQSGLIAYLGLDRFRGSVQPMVTRTVWWTRPVSDGNGEKFIIFLADKHRWGTAADGSAYIVTDDNWNLVHWEGTGLLRDSTQGLIGQDDVFPIHLTQRLDLTPTNLSRSIVTIDLEFDLNAVSGVRAK